MANKLLSQLTISVLKNKLIPLTAGAHVLPGSQCPVRLTGWLQRYTRYSNRELIYITRFTYCCGTFGDAMFLLKLDITHYNEPPKSCSKQIPEHDIFSASIVTMQPVPSYILTSACDYLVPTIRLLRHRNACPVYQERLAEENCI